MGSKMLWFRSEDLTLANMLTLLRIIMASAAACCFALSYAETFAVLLCLAASFLDAVDGWIARALSQCSNLGRWFDPIADKILIGVMYTVIAVKVDSMAVWLLFSMIAFREAGITALRIYAYRSHKLVIPTNKISKSKMVAQSLYGNGILVYGFLLTKGFYISDMIVVVPLVFVTGLTYWSAFISIRPFYRKSTAIAPEVDSGSMQDEYEEPIRLIAGDRH